MKSTLQKTLEELRRKIDLLDEQVLRVLEQRGDCVIEIGKIKRELKTKFYVPERECEIFQKLLKKNRGPYQRSAIRAIFREIISASLALESPLKIAYLGPKATFTHVAAMRRFGLSAEFVPQENIAAAFEAVFLRRAHFGVVPIENSTEGVVSHTLDLFIEHDLKICGETKIPISQFLLSKEEKLENIQKVYSHPQALAQCQKWLRMHLPKVDTIQVASTAKAAEIASSEKYSAAIASEYAAELYNLNVLASHIEDQLNNATRFVVIGHEDCTKTDRDKTSIVCSTRDEVGALYRLLAILSRFKINLTKIESRPLKGKPWEYVFFMDLEGHRLDENVSAALVAMEKRCTLLKILGSYPRAD